jgi:hypothetical protein
MHRRAWTLVVLMAVAAPMATAQNSATISAPDVAKAGEIVDLVITLDKAPNFNGGGLSVTVHGPGDFSINSGCEVKQGENVCHYPLHVPEAAASGTWYVSKLMFFTGFQNIDLPFQKISFQVIGKRDLVFPTSAQVLVNPSQIQLLRRETARLQTEIQTLKAAVADAQKASLPTVPATLRRQVQAEIISLRATQENFHKLSAQSPNAAAATVFFDDLATSYDEVLSSLSTQKTEADVKAHVVLSAWRPPVAGAIKNATYPLAAQAVFRVFEQNELAYAIVADTESLTFDLEVETSPAGATVSYHRRGDPYKDNPSPTNSVIKDLPYAIWIVRFQMPGFQEKEIEHDPFREHNHKLHWDLSKK